MNRLDPRPRLALLAAALLLGPNPFLLPSHPSFLGPDAAMAQPARNHARAPAGNRNPQVRNSSRANINGGGAANHNVNRNVNRNANVNRNVNVNVHGGGNYYGGGGGCYGCGWDDHHDFAAGMAVGAVTGAVVGAAAASSNRSTTTVVVAPGTVVTALPSGCSAVVSSNMTYQQCGSVWYQPTYAGTSVQYVVVAHP